MLDNDITDVIESTFSVLKEVDPATGSDRPKPPPKAAAGGAGGVYSSPVNMRYVALELSRTVSDGEDEDEAGSPSRGGPVVYDEVELVPDGSNLKVFAQRILMCILYMSIVIL